MFPKNEGPADRIIRIVAGIVLLSVGSFLLDGVQGSVVGLVVAIVGLFALLTGATGRCVLYIPFGITTLRAPSGHVPHPTQREVPEVRRREDALR